MQLQKEPLNKYWLINEAFVLWYILLEDISLENFEEEKILQCCIRITTIMNGFFDRIATALFNGLDDEYFPRTYNI